MAIYYFEFFDDISASAPDDIRLAIAVGDRLEMELPDRGCRVLLEVQNQVVILKGDVPSSEAIQLTRRIVWETPGVADLSNQLTVQPPP